MSQELRDQILESLKKIGQILVVIETQTIPISSSSTDMKEKEVKKPSQLIYQDKTHIQHTTLNHHQLTKPTQDYPLNTNSLYSKQNHIENHKDPTILHQSISTSNQTIPMQKSKEPPITYPASTHLPNEDQTNKKQYEMNKVDRDIYIMKSIDIQPSKPVKTVEHQTIRIGENQTINNHLSSSTIKTNNQPFNKSYTSNQAQAVNQKLGESDKIVENAPYILDKQGNKVYIDIKNLSQYRDIASTTIPRHIRENIGAQVVRPPLHQSISTVDKDNTLHHRVSSRSLHRADREFREADEEPPRYNVSREKKRRSRSKHHSYREEEGGERRRSNYISIEDNSRNLGQNSDARYVKEYKKSHRGLPVHESHHRREELYDGNVPKIVKRSNNGATSNPPKPDFYQYVEKNYRNIN